MFSKALCVALVCVSAARAAPSIGRRQGGDPQTSLTLDPAVIATGFENDGQDVPAAGQVPSLTSSNNFINFCLTVPNLPITNGKQITTGSCNPAPIGVIPSVDKMPSSKFVFPTNFGAVKVNTAFTIQMAISNLQTGNFVNAQANYFAAPQVLNTDGVIIGHSHVVIEKLDSFGQTTPTNPKVFAFFKGLNLAAVNGIMSTDVTAGLPEGSYKISSINAAMNHQPAIVPVAQHGSLDDAVYFSVTQDGNPPPGAVGAVDPPAGTDAPAPTDTSAPAATTTSDAAAATTTSDAAAATTSAAQDPPAAGSSSSSAAGAAQVTTTSAAAAATQAAANFGRCGAPSVSFGTLSGRRGTFYRSGNTASFPVAPARQIGSVVDSICNRVNTSCRANQAAKQLCTKAATAAKQAPTNNGGGADIFNLAFGKTTNFKNVPAQ
jgi:hypothetical protein